MNVSKMHHPILFGPFLHFTEWVYKVYPWFPISKDSYASPAFYGCSLTVVKRSETISRKSELCNKVSAISMKVAIRDIIGSVRKRSGKWTNILY